VGDNLSLGPDRRIFRRKEGGRREKREQQRKRSVADESTKELLVSRLHKKKMSKIERAGTLAREEVINRDKELGSASCSKREKAEGEIGASEGNCSTR